MRAVRKAARRCTAALDTHSWRGVQRLLLSLYDRHDFAEQFIVWQCVWCGRHTWADAMVHRHAGAMSPLAWEASVERERQQPGPWGTGWTAIERHQRQGTHLLRQSLAMQH